MRCPSCGAELAVVSGQAARCGCGWRAATVSRLGLRLLVAGVAVDFVGSALLGYALVVDRGWLLPAGVAMAVGMLMVVAGALQFGRASTRK